MDKFEKIIKEAVEGYEAPFDPQAWDNISNDLNDSFDQMIKESTSTYEAPYNPSAWEAVSSQLEPAYSAWKWIAGAAAAVVVIAGSSYLSTDNSTTDNKLPAVTTNTVIAEDNIDHTLITDETTSTQDVQEVADNTVEIGNEAETVTVDQADEHDVIRVEENDLIADNNVTDRETINDQETTINNQESDIIIGGTPDDVQVDENDIPEKVNYTVSADFGVRNATVCQGEDTRFTPEAINNELIYIWNFGDGATSSNELGVHAYERAGEYEVRLEVRNPENNRLLSSASKTIIVNPAPKADFDWEQKSDAIPSVTFKNSADNATKVQWNVKNLKSTSANSFEYTFRKAGEYTVELTATNSFGCRSTAEKVIRIENDYNLLAPTAFTPDGDGENDFFIPEALKVMDVDFTMTIMDKTGKPVFVTRNPYEAWDGRFANDNTLAPNGSSYIWRVVLTNKNGEREMYEGQVFVLR